MLNRIILIGRLTMDPETRLTSTENIPVTRFTIAVDRPVRKDSDKGRVTDFIRIITWRKLAEICKEYLKKGLLVGIEGRLQVRGYSAADGTKRTIAEVVADNVQFLERAVVKETMGQNDKTKEATGEYVEKLDEDLDENIELEAKDPFKDL